MKKNLVLTLTLILFCTALTMAKTKKITVTGIVVDKACSAKVAGKENPQEAAAGHTKKCALMPDCAKSGYGVFVDGKYHEFDAKGTALAKALLEKSTTDKGVKFVVVGKTDDATPNVIMVSKISEAK